ncbi:hypothetical protein ACFQJ5_02860 [Halomicroarcula sp. GCM10025324]|jgi:hypothetical protein|uniref:DUF7511 domain-containing protein n=1 Tax=Haloarcula TaxID=2237 RepID=UPI0023E8247B|nr:hypothetical protein [Halomicroarcula sp. ZS-22-S1]
MSTNWHSPVGDEAAARDPLPQDDFADEVLVAEVEPTANGPRRALVYPNDAPAHRVADQWLAVGVTALVDLDDAR